MRRAAFMFAGLALTASAVMGGEGNVRRNARSIPDRYVVVLEQSTDTASFASALRNVKGAKVRHTYQRGVKGFALEMSEADAQALARDPRVQYVEADFMVSAADTTWGLDRIDQRSLPLNGSYVTEGSGAGITIYVVDTGILATHQEFGGRVAEGFSAFNDSRGTTDCNGHGTHVAGIAGGATFGVASASTLVPVRVLDCNGSGSLSTVLAGLDWIIERHIASPRPSVVNMSLAGDASSSLDGQVKRLVAEGITTIVAAGNNNSDACATSPARVREAITVGASTENDERAAFSNFGGCLDVFAPGTNILSSFYASETATGVTSGTSASAPFVAGVAALALERYPAASPHAVANTVLSQSTPDALALAGEGSPNLLLFSTIGALDESPLPALQLLADPGFEYGTTFWTSDICSVLNPSGCPPSMITDYGYGGGFDYYLQSLGSRSGKNRAVIGGPAKTFHVMSEVVNVPSAVRSAQFSVHIWVVTKNKKQSADDVLTVEVRDASGALLETLGTFTNLDASPAYAQHRYDVSHYRGRSIRISFTGVQSQGPPTWFLLDDAALTVSR